MYLFAINSNEVYDYIDERLQYEPFVFREALKNYIDEKMKDGNIACSDANEIVKSMVDYTCLEQWKTSGLSTDDFFLQNAIALTSTQR